MSCSILVAIEPELYTRLFSLHSDALLRRLGRITFASAPIEDSARLAEMITPYDILITGWQTPAITAEVMAAAPKLRLIAHSAGTVRHLISPDVFECSVQITHAAAAMGPSVAEACLAMMLTSLRNIHELDRQLKAGGSWTDVRSHGFGRQIRGMAVGIVGAGHTGRAFIQLLQGFGARLLIYDPYLSETDANSMCVVKTMLDELLASCTVVALHAPSLPETHHMIGARELTLMQDGALLINTARSWLIDHDALLRELSTGRISAALDVYDQEPLPVDSPLRRLPNVLLTPHIGSYTREAYFEQGQIVVDEIRRFLAGDPLKYAIQKEQMATMA